MQNQYGPWWGIPRETTNTLIPTVIEREGNRERVTDIYSKLLEERIIKIFEPITDTLASSVIAQMLFLQKTDPNKPISIYIHSGGGSVYAGMGILDTMTMLKQGGIEVHTINCGMAASMASMILAYGSRGARQALPNSTTMIHSVSSGAPRGTVHDLRVGQEETERLQARLMGLLAERCGKEVEEVIQDCERDRYMDLESALEYGIIDRSVINQK